MNVLTITGRITKEPKLRSTQSGKSVCTLAIADRNKGKTQYLNIAVFGELAENCVKYLEVGQSVSVRAELSIRSEKQNDEKWVTYTNIYGFDVEFLNKSSKNNNTVNEDTQTGIGGNQILGEDLQEILMDDDELPF